MATEEVSVLERGIRTLGFVPRRELKERESASAMVELARQADRLELRVCTAGTVSIDL